MTDCTCKNQSNQTAVAHVPNFTVVGFNAQSQASAPLLNPAVLEGVEALALSVCVSASYNPANNQICFSIPIYGSYCVASPIGIPVGGVLKVCAQTCGSIFPTGLKATVYLNNNVIYTYNIFGSC